MPEGGEAASILAGSMCSTKARGQPQDGPRQEKTVAQSDIRHTHTNFIRDVKYAPELDTGGPCLGRKAIFCPMSNRCIGNGGRTVFVRCLGSVVRAGSGGSKLGLRSPSNVGTGVAGKPIVVTTL